MRLDEYQKLAATTTQATPDLGRDELVPLLGLAGEVGSLLSEYKKRLRDGGGHPGFRDRVAEDLGDLLWYLAGTATQFSLTLDEVARQNLEKVRSRWPPRDPAHVDLVGGAGTHLLDDDYPPRERFPRMIEVEFEEVRDGDALKVVVRRDGKPFGDPLTDNAPDDDGYRFHDVFHLSYAALLGWSPILRKLLRVKRKSDRRTDTVEDGARAAIIEELISQLVFQYAREHNFLEGVGTLDHHLLKTIHSLVQDREVRVRTLYEWENAILSGYRVWRQVRANGGGLVRADLTRRTFEYVDEVGAAEA